MYLLYAGLWLHQRFVFAQSHSLLTGEICLSLCDLKGSELFPGAVLLMLIHLNPGKFG